MFEERESRANMVKSICCKILEQNLRHLEYNPSNCRELAVKLSELIRNEVKRALSGRYKIVSTVRIGPLQSQGFNIVSRCLWRPDTDSSANSVFKNSSIFAVATVFWVSNEWLLWCFGHRMNESIHVFLCPLQTANSYFVFHGTIVLWYSLVKNNKLSCLKFS